MTIFRLNPIIVVVNTEILNLSYLKPYKIVRAPDYLQEIIELFWEKNIDEFTHDCVLPNVGFTLVFHLKGSFTLKFGTQKLDIMDHIILPRQYTIENIAQQSHSFGIRFKSGFIHHFFDLPQEFFTLPSSLRPYLDKRFVIGILQAGSFEERVELSKNYFSRILEQMRHRIRINAEVNALLGYLENGHFAEFKVNQRSKDQFLSSKTLCRYFLQTTGITPKRAFCIVRVRAALAAFKENPKNFENFNFGYYDYSHFYKEVKLVTGINLSKIKSSFSDQEK